MNLIYPLINRGLKLLKIIDCYANFNLIFKLLDSGPLSALKDLIFNHVNTTVFAFLIDFYTHVCEILIEFVEFILLFLLLILQCLSQSVNPRVKFILLSVELVTAERFAANQIDLLESLLLHFIYLTFYIFKFCKLCKFLFFKVNDVRN